MNLFACKFLHSDLRLIFSHVAKTGKRKCFYFLAWVTYETSKNLLWSLDV